MRPEEDEEQHVYAGMAAALRQEFPEVDRSGWFAIDEAKRKINPAQINLVEELQQVIEFKENR